MRHLLLAALLLPAAAFAQVTFSTSIGGAYVPLDGATVKGSISVRLAGCPAGSPWAYAIDGNPANEEYTCPFDLIGDDTLYDTTALTNGPHVITAKASSTLTARFTVANGVTPAPPTTPVPPSGVQGVSGKIWFLPVTQCTDGTTATPCTIDAYRIECDQGISVVLPPNTASPYQLQGLTPSSSYSCVMAARLGQVWSYDSARVMFTTAAAPPTCPAQPAPETRAQTCIAPLVGSWSQSRSYVSVPAPACWQPGAWTPDIAPAGVCATPPPPAAVWRVRSIASGTRPASELVRNATDTAWVLGYKLGDIAVGQLCATARELGSGASEYHKVLEADAVLLSPTYKGRTLVAVCARQ